LERTRELFDHRRLARSANSHVADADNQTAERSLPKNSLSIQIEPQLNDARIKKRQRKEEPSENGRPKSATPTKNDVDPELFQIF
jgi:hypothetical protein